MLKCEILKIVFYLCGTVHFFSLMIDIECTVWAGEYFYPIVIIGEAWSVDVWKVNIGYEECHRFVFFKYY